MEKLNRNNINVASFKQPSSSYRYSPKNLIMKMEKSVNISAKKAINDTVMK